MLFHAHLTLLHTFVANRSTVVSGIERLLNCQKQPLHYQQDQVQLGRHFKDCFFSVAALTAEQVALRDQLEVAHWASGFKPRQQPGNDFIDPVALVLRVLHLWRQTQWPGSRGRLRFAHTLFNAYLLRCLGLLLLRMWDAGAVNVSDRLKALQQLLDAVWASTPAEQGALLRDVRWLFPLVLSPTTDELGGYFAVAQQIAQTLPLADSTTIQQSWVQTGAAHLRSQLRHLSVQRGVDVDDHALLLRMRVSNTLDTALLLEGLVSLLTAYAHALHNGDSQQRLTLAAAICEGFSPDPELFIKRPDLLGPYSMIEHLFISTDASGNASYTAAGQRHLQLLAAYSSLLNSLVQPLSADCLACQPITGAYSPFGLLYGFASNLLELMAFKNVQLAAEQGFSLEAAFSPGGADKRAWVVGWRQLPHISAEIVQQYAYPDTFALAMHTRVAQALQQQAAGATASRGSPTPRLFVVPPADQAAAPALPVQFIHSSDPALVAQGGASVKAAAELMSCRLEGEYLVSYQTAGGWVGISKDLLTEVIGQGSAATLSGLPATASAVLRLMCPAWISPPVSVTPQ